MAAVSVIADNLDWLRRHQRNWIYDAVRDLVGRRVSGQPGSTAVCLLFLAQLHDSRDVSVARLEYSRDEQRQLRW